MKHGPAYSACSRMMRWERDEWRLRFMGFVVRCAAACAYRAINPATEVNVSKAGGFLSSPEHRGRHTRTG